MLPRTLPIPVTNIDWFSTLTLEYHGKPIFTIKEKKIVMLLSPSILDRWILNLKCPTQPHYTTVEFLVMVESSPASLQIPPPSCCPNSCPQQPSLLATHKLDCYKKLLHHRARGPPKSGIFLIEAGPHAGHDEGSIIRRPETWPWLSYKGHMVEMEQIYPETEAQEPEPSEVSEFPDLEYNGNKNIYGSCSFGKTFTTLSLKYARDGKGFIIIIIWYWWC